MNYKTKFQWTPSISAPRNYPVETKYVSLGYGSDGEEYPIMNSYSDAGIAVTKGKVSFEQLEDTEGLDIPNSINALWLSYTESKIYEVHTNFPIRFSKRYYSYYVMDIMMRMIKNILLIKTSL